jgi:hypothetical protein
MKSAKISILIMVRPEALMARRYSLVSDVSKLRRRPEEVAQRKLHTADRIA